MTEETKTVGNDDAKHDPFEGESPASKRPLSMVLGRRETIEQLAYKYSVPLFGKLHHDGSPRLLATGWFFHCGTRWFLVSARHVFVDCFPTPAKFLTPGANDCDLLVPVRGGAVAVSGPVHHAQGDDDVAVMALSESVASLLRERWTPVTMDMVDIPTTTMLPGPHIVAGFPKATMSIDQPDPNGMRSLRGEPFVGASLWDQEASMRATKAAVNFHPAKHVIIRFGCNPAHPESELGGISGAPVWRLEESHRGVRFRLAAVETSVFGSGPHRFIRATRWWVVRELLRELDAGLIEASERVVRALAG